MAVRDYTTRRLGIVEGLAEKLKDIDGTGSFLSDLNRNVSPRLKFWDEVEEFPAIHLNAGGETREYQGGGYKDRGSLLENTDTNKCSSSSLFKMI
jgi:hypothetical protein